MTDMRINLPGLLKERMPSGAYRYRVRVEGNKTKRIALTVTPEHPEFMEIYYAARLGVALQPRKPAPDRVVRDTVEWLTAAYLAHLEGMVKAGKASPLTLKQRRHFFARLNAHRAAYGKAAGQPFAGLHMDIPPEELVAFRDAYASTSGAADNMIKAVRSLYAWAIERRLTDVNPAVGIGKIHTGQGGATPWTVADLSRYRDTHKPGTQAHLTLTLFMFTACRIGDAVVLGRAHEETNGGITWLSWQPGKRGAKPVSIPMLPPLYAATRAQAVVGKTYLLNAYGQPWASPEALRNRFKEWCREAGLPDLSAHGIRKAAGKLLAEAGATQHQIMAIHGHAEAKTSEIYTRAADRARLAKDAMALLAGLEW
jgi:integrase